MKFNLGDKVRIIDNINCTRCTVGSHRAVNCSGFTGEICYISSKNYTNYPYQVLWNKEIDFSYTKCSYSEDSLLPWNIKELI